MTSVLTMNQSILVTFVGGTPPLMSDGFWSLTLYNEEGYLISNPLNIYALGDRSNLTYADGSLVYGSNSKLDPRSPFQILVQSSDASSPLNWSENWLPGPTGGGPVQLTLRFYAQEPGLEDGSYQYPVIQNIITIAGA